MSTLTCEKTTCWRLNQTKIEIQHWGENKVCDVKWMDKCKQSTITRPLAQTRVNVNFGCWENEIIFQDRLKECVVIDVHQRCISTSGVNNYQTLKRRVHFFNCKNKIISSYMKACLQEVWAPLNLKKIFLQNGFIKNAKPNTQIWSHQSPIP